MDTMRKVVIVLVLIIGLVAATAAAGQYELRMDMVKLGREVVEDMNAFGNSNISLSTLVNRMENHKEKGSRIYERSLETNDANFIRVSAGFSLALDLYYLGFKNYDPKMIEAANTLLSEVVTPSIRK